MLVRSSVQPLFKMFGENLIAAACQRLLFLRYIRKQAARKDSGIAEVNQVNSEAWRNRKVSERASPVSIFSGPAVSHGERNWTFRGMCSLALWNTLSASAGRPSGSSKEG